MVANFHSGPMSSNELEPLRSRVLSGFGAREVEPGFGAGGGCLLEGALAPHQEERPGIRKICFQWLDGKRVDGASFYAPVAGLSLGKKGVFLSPSSAWAFLKSLS